MKRLLFLGLKMKATPIFNDYGDYDDYDDRKKKIEIFSTSYNLSIIY